jgi:hypothetical protein
MNKTSPSQKTMEIDAISYLRESMGVKKILLLARKRALDQLALSITNVSGATIDPSNPTMHE